MEIMPGQVDQDSIIGNKEKTKQYWEVRLRKDQDEKDKAAKKGSLSSNSVIKKMNAEIEELHRREKELKRMNNTLITKASDDEDEDILSSNGSSVDEFEPSESPRLESGFYSNAGEDELGINSPEIAKYGTKNNNSNNSNDSKKTTTTIEITLQQDESVIVEEVSLEEVQSPNDAAAQENNGAADENVTPPFHIANYRKETPIEREIRMAREREQEYKLRRSSIMSNDSQVQQQQAPTLHHTVVVTHSPTPPAASSTPESSVKPISFHSARNIFESRETTGGMRDAQGKDAQYTLATERLKKEILEAKMREEELKTRTLSKSSTLEDNTFADTNGSKSSSGSDLNKQDEVEAPVTAAPPSLQVQEEVVTVAPVHATPVAVYRQIESTVIKQSSIETAPLSPQPPNVKSPKTPSTPGAASTYQTFSFLAKNPKLNTLERRYLLKPSMQLRIATNFQIPKSEGAEVGNAEENGKPEDATAADAAEQEQEVEKDEPVVPRRRLVSTQQRIAAELREMREREKELELTRKYRSTSDLSSLQLQPLNDDHSPSHQSDDDVFSENNGSVTNEEQDFPIMVRSALGNQISFGASGKGRSALGNQISFGAPGATGGNPRKKSNLVSQWEEKIQGGNDKIY